jgi:AraC-like DNA-binding protein
MRKDLSDRPGASPGVLRDDVLSSLIATIRLTGSLQFCFMPTGAWQTDATPAMAGLSKRLGGAIPFHVVVSGECWLRMGDERTELGEGDVVVFPFGDGHQLGAGPEGRLVLPTGDLPPQPWREIPVLRYGGDGVAVRLLCGYLEWDGLSFAPLRQALPRLIHVRTRGANDGDWLRATLRQMTAEVDSPRTGGVAMLPRLTEILFIEILRHQVTTAAPDATGWLAALADPCLARCLSAIHAEPLRDWSLAALAALSGLSRSTLAERFEGVVGTSPIRYVRDWRLHLACLALATGGRTIATVAHETGYATEAAFNRAFRRAYGTPPAAWRDRSVGNTAAT